ncbi:MAG: LEPR-XLL domain-containing protein, partial [Rubrivivax sp.]|nr:LEPR-XLL domain-containing protein [Rubrivivax sp.]
MTRTLPACLRPVAEAMERRILHSADIGPLLLGGAGVFDGATLHTAQPDAAVARQEIVFVD